MPLPIRIEELFKGLTVESDRLDYKEGFDPEKAAQTICAFANDINNIGGGYIVFGVKSADGAPELPPAGLKESQVEAFQKKIIEARHKIMPFPQVVVSPETYLKKRILVLWVPGGENRPYKAPISYTGTEKTYYIRRHSTTVKANQQEEKQLLEISARIPFDDRINHNADMRDMKRDIILQFLKDSGSGLYETAKDVSVPELCRLLQVCRGSKENVKPINAGLLMFSDDPEEFFPGARIEIAEFEDIEGTGRKFTEKVFKGPIHRQLKAALEYIRNMVLKENIRKIPGRAEAERIFNYPYQAVEEILANAVYHRGYDLRDPIEVNVFPDRMEFVSKPGPMPPVNNNDLKKTRVPVREYRNRRLGDFLKELDMTEAKGTGFPEIRRALKENGSPGPRFETNKDRTYFLAILKPHKLFAGLKIKETKSGMGSELSQGGTKSALSRHQVNLDESEIIKVLKFCIDSKSAMEMMAQFKWKDRTKFKNKYIKPLIKLKLLNMTIPDKPSSSRQKYITTQKGMKVLEKAKQI